jgi:hypothetical protein
MKYLLIAAVLAAIPIQAFAADVGLSVSVGQPGFYGRLNIGDVPQQPRVIYQQPRVIYRAPRGEERQPVYLRVPPGHRKNWKRHCNEYNACGEPVYFVRNDWYTNVYAKHHRDRGDNRGDSRGDDQGQKHDNGRGRGQGHEKN